MVRLDPRLTTLSATLNQGFFTLLLAFHVLGLITLSGAFGQAVAVWVAVNAVAFLGVRARGIRSLVQPKVCPYCEEPLIPSRFRCPNHGDLTPENP